MALFGKKDENPNIRPVWKGPEKALGGMIRPIDELEPDRLNPRAHPQRNIDAIAASLRRFGQRKPIVVRGSKIVAGHGTVLAASVIGWTHLAMANADDLTEEEARAYGIADNKTSDLAEWDHELLRDYFKRLGDDLIPDTAFESTDDDSMTADDFVPPAAVPSGGSEGVSPEPGSDPIPEMTTFLVTEDQATVIRGAIAKVRESEQAGDEELSEGRCLELIAADWLSGQ